MTEETHHQPEKSSNDKKTIMPVENQSSMDVSKPKVDNKKEKCKPMTKVIIRRLPPTMNESQLIEQISPLPDHDYLHFVRADRSLGQNAYSRAYINFVDQQDIFVFREKFDNYVFLDSKGIEYPAVVEFAPFQRLPKKRVNKKKDQKCATITTDPYYMTFLESLKNQDADSTTTQPKTEYSYQPFDNAQKRVTTTPLLEFLKVRKAEKQRMRDEKREERRRRDIERRRTKEEPAISKVLKNPDTERDVGRDHKDNNNIREEKIPSSNTREPKNRKKDEVKLRDKASNSRDTGKSYRDREERKQERENKLGNKKHEDKKSYNNRREEKEDRKESRKRDEAPATTTNRVFEEKKGKSYEKTRQEKRLRLAESKKQDVPVDETSIVSIEKKKADDNDVKSRENPPNKTSKTDSNAEHTVTDEPVIKLPHSIELPDNIVDDEQFLNTKKSPKTLKRRSSLGSGGEGGGGDGACLRRHKSLDGGDESNLQKSENDDKDKDKKDPRLERRIRNKDRPAMEIYRPGMGKFSKQRLERGKSIQDDRASLSQSPTPGGKPSSMIFKRSISRDTT